MSKITFYSTNNKSERVDFQTALMNGLASEYGLYMMAKSDIPRLRAQTIKAMAGMTYARIAFEVLNPFLAEEIDANALAQLLEDAYDETKIPTTVQHVTGKTFIMWLTQGPTYSFKDYAARFFGRVMNHFLKQSDRRRVVAVATSGDTGGAVADALNGLDRVDNLVFFPKESITEQQRRQMTTLGGNVHAFAVNGDFDVCQALAKRLIGDKSFAEQVFGDAERFTSANSISVGRLLPQAVYPFFAYSRVAKYDAPLIASVPSGNFGDMMGTVIAKAMGLPIEPIICGVNENREFPTFLETGKFDVLPSVYSPSSAMIVANPSNFARLVDFYDGHVYDERDADGRVTREGVMDVLPDIGAMRKNFVSLGVDNADHYYAMKEVYERYGITVDPHGAVGWRVLDTYLQGRHDQLAVIFETADPGKFPDDVHKAIGVTPAVPEGIAKQADLTERIYPIEQPADTGNSGSLVLSDAQYADALEKIRGIYS
ncbi:threonine synthase [Desulfosarcina ovata subsp. sediminis]|uniref:Threonine synthase n=1 Tax=Desulfosarcina ovata subsp. sediminis TaxID=885957 RepID=A0A5K8A0R0_9BACT|nr:threonine synthase [Desulfosarcina ovata]BBO85981.1 threonine synthase [Desulfosarcina ovata subsp. sediminis]